MSRIRPRFVAELTDRHAGPPHPTLRPGFLPALVLAAALVGASAVSARATIRLVPSEYPTIQEAVDACVSGDEVRVAPGTYRGAGNVWITFNGRDIAVLSEGGPDVTTIDGEAAAPAFHLASGETPAARIEGFTIVNGEFVAGGGIYCGYSSPTVRDCAFRNCHAIDGGGMYLSFSDAQVEACTFVQCRAAGGPYGGSGGAMVVENGSPRVTDCLFQNNTAEGIEAFGSGKGGGIEAIGGTFLRCRFYGNTATFAGGGIDFLSGLLQDCILAGNRSGWGGGCSSAASEIEGCTIVGNEALHGPQGFAQGGGVLVWGGNSIVRRSIVWGNCADAEGDQIYARLSFVATLDCMCTDPAGLQGNWIDLGNNVFFDPIFCAPLPCSPEAAAGDYSLRIDSPCLPAQSPCGERIGALDAGCLPPTPVVPASWGRIKADFR